MKLFKKYQSNKGAMGLDIIVSLTVMSLFAGMIAGMFAELFKQNVSIRMNATATNYAIKILEDTDRLSYAEVTTENMMENIQDKYGISSNYTPTVEVVNYNETENNTDKEDVIKIVTVTITYMMQEEEYTYTVKKLKIKEM